MKLSMFDSLLEPISIVIGLFNSNMIQVRYCLQSNDQKEGSFQESTLRFSKI